MRILFIVFSGALTVSACGGGPTAPTSAQPPVQQPTVTTDPTAPPTPAPAPDPAPVPSPSPSPTPAPAPVPSPKGVTWYATTETAHWLGPELLSGNFDVSWANGTLHFDSLDASIVTENTEGVFATIAGSNAASYTTIQITLEGERGTWAFIGPAGQATGTLQRVTP